MDDWLKIDEKFRKLFRESVRPGDSEKLVQDKARIIVGALRVKFGASEVHEWSTRSETPARTVTAFLESRESLVAKA